MPKPHPSTWLPLLDRALDCEIGIAVPVSGGTAKHFRNELYEARKASGNPAYDELILFLPEGPALGEVWICRKSVSLEE